jgi:hypothetical protein
MATNLIGQSTEAGVAGVQGESTTSHGVKGVTSARGDHIAAIVGICEVPPFDEAGNKLFAGPGVLGHSAGVGVWGKSTSFHGVKGETSAPLHAALVGESNAPAVDPAGQPAGPGVLGRSPGVGVWGASTTWHGVYGQSDSTTGGAGVMGENSKGSGVIGKSKSWIGVYGESETSSGVWGKSKEWAGVFGFCESTTTGAGVWGKGGRVAGYFEGSVEVTGDIILSNADCAEDFNIGADLAVEPGTVMVLVEEDALVPSWSAYDKRVAGVISGAGSYRPGIVLDKQPSAGLRQPLALLGKVFCKVDAQYSAIEVGDLLTTSATQGHAMKADDPLKAFGTVIGKALRPLKEGCGLIPILIALQ